MVNLLRDLTGPLLGLILLAFNGMAQAAQGGGVGKLDIAALAQRTMTEFEVPGMAIGIVQGGKVAFAQGFGAREIGKKGQVDGKTLFRIASNSKAFTTAALATLVDDGLISWDGLVIDYIPEFRMYDPWVTREITVTDLLTHRSGLAPFKGDLLLWPEPNAFTTNDIMHALRFFEPVSSFRSTYAYDNLLYIVAGEIIPRLTGQAWGEFVERRLMRPAGMQRCFADRVPKKQMKNLAAPHAVIEGELAVVERNRITEQPPVSAAAGGVVCSLDDMLSWTLVQLNRGKTPGGEVLFSASRSQEMWSPNIHRRVSPRDYNDSKTHFRAYGLGWRLADVHGYLQVSHTGTLSGMRSNLVMVPELELGFVYLSNGSSSEARTAVTNTIVRSFMPVEQIDWVQRVIDERSVDTSVQTADEPDCLPCATPELSRFTGVYRDPWFGDVTVSLQGDELMFAALKSPRLTGALTACDGRRFVVRWRDRSLQADAFLHFEIDNDGTVSGMSMSKLDPGGYDFEDLAFIKVENQ